MAKFIYHLAMTINHASCLTTVAASILLGLAGVFSSDEAVADDTPADGVLSSQHLINDLMKAYDPCAGSPLPAVCRCALEFPPVTYDTSVDFTLKASETGEYDLATGRTLMNFVRGIVVAAAPPPTDEEGLVVNLYANPPATPDAMTQLDAVVSRNPNFRHAKLVKVMMMPRFIGGEPDRLYGGIWWLEKTRTLLVIYRGTQTPFEWFLDLQGGEQRTISDSFKVAYGFGAAYQFCQPEVLDAVATYQPKDIFIGGHSLGASVAGITALDLHQRSQAAGNAYAVHAMTFGQPRTFDPAAANLVNAAIKAGNLELWRIANIPDPCPSGPPAAVTGDGVKYKHTAAVVFYDYDISALPGRDAAWNHHWYYEGYFDPDVQGLVGQPQN